VEYPFTPKSQDVTVPPEVLIYGGGVFAGGGGGGRVTCGHSVTVTVEYIVVGAGSVQVTSTT